MGAAKEKRLGNSEREVRRGWLLAQGRSRRRRAARRSWRPPGCGRPTCTWARRRAPSRSRSTSSPPATRQSDVVMWLWVVGGEVGADGGRRLEEEHVRDGVPRVRVVEDVRHARRRLVLEAVVREHVCRARVFLVRSGMGERERQNRGGSHRVRARRRGRSRWRRRRGHRSATERPGPCSACCRRTGPRSSLAEIGTGEGTEGRDRRGSVGDLLCEVLNQ